MNDRPSLSFPFFLITVGVIWLLISLGSLPARNLWALTQVWPFLLIAAGVSLIVRSYWPAGGMIVSALSWASVLLSILYAPQLGWDSGNLWNLPVDFIGGGERGSGNVITETRQIGGFDTIRLEYPAEVFIVQGSEPALRIEAEDNLMPQLRSEVRNDVLTIENSERTWGERVDPTETVQIYITVTDLSSVLFPSAGRMSIEGLQGESLSLILSGAGDITMTELDVGELDCVLTGAGSLTVDGRAASLNVRIDGFGSLHAEELAAQTANVSINGAGNAELWVEDSLSASINGAGSISYIGSPQVSQSINGLGSISRKGD